MSEIERLEELANPMKIPESFNAEDQQAVHWLEEAAAGHVEGLEALYNIYHKGLFGILYRILNDQESAEEVLQDTFVRVWDKAGTYNADLAKPFSWIVQIGRNLAFDRIRKRNRRPKIISVSGEQNNFYEDKYLSDFDANGENSEMQEMLESKIAALPPFQKKAIELAFFNGLTQEEIAGKLGRPLGTVKSDIRRGLLKLRALGLEE